MVDFSSFIPGLKVVYKNSEGVSLYGRVLSVDLCKGYVYCQEADGAKFGFFPISREEGLYSSVLEYTTSFSGHVYLQVGNIQKEVLPEDVFASDFLIW